MAQCMTEVKECTSLHKFFEVLLALGNYLNGTTARGGAYGFNLGSLAKMAELKSVDQKTTLLEYAVGYC